MKKTVILGMVAAILAALPAQAANANQQVAQADAPQPNPLDPQPAAPVTPTGDQPGWMQYKSPYAAEENDIANANRTSDEIMAWGDRVVADTLSFTPDNYKEQLKASQKFFVQTGWQDCVAYLKEAKLLESVQGGYAVATIADGPPILVNSGAQDGAWHWELSVPIITSLSAKDPQGEQQTLSNKKGRLRLLLKRVAEGGDDGLAVVSWRAEQQ